MNTRPEVANGSDRLSLAQKNSADDKLRSLHHQFSIFINEMESLAQQTVALPYEELKGISEQLNNRINAAKTSLEETAKSAAASLQHNGGKIIAAANHQVHERPWYVLGITTAAAVVLGFVIGQQKTGTTNKV